MIRGCGLVTAWFHELQPVCGTRDDVENTLVSRNIYRKHLLLQDRQLASGGKSLSIDIGPELLRFFSLMVEWDFANISMPENAIPQPISV